MGIIVIANAVSIGFQIDYPTYLTPHEWLQISFAFFVIFFSEIVFKLVAYGTNFFWDPWNVFDFVVTVLVGIE